MTGRRIQWIASVTLPAQRVTFPVSANDDDPSGAAEAAEAGLAQALAEHYADNMPDIDVRPLTRGDL